MSQKAVESLLGRLVTDQDFRHRFYVEPAATCRAESLDVTGRELEAILAVDETHFDVLAEHLDPRVVRAALQVEGGVGAAGKAGAEPAGAKLTAVK